MVRRLALWLLYLLPACSESYILLCLQAIHLRCVFDQRTLCQFDSNTTFYKQMTTGFCLSVFSHLQDKHI
jgi:hypothetical protein